MMEIELSEFLRGLVAVIVLIITIMKRINEVVSLNNLVMIDNDAQIRTLIYV